MALAHPKIVQYAQRDGQDANRPDRDPPPQSRIGDDDEAAEQQRKRRDHETQSHHEAVDPLMQFTLQLFER